MNAELGLSTDTPILIFFHIQVSYFHFLYFSVSNILGVQSFDLEKVSVSNVKFLK